jgi:hypothetical protein
MGCACRRRPGAVAALGIDSTGAKHPLGLVEGATENAAVMQALIDNLIERGLDPSVCRLFIFDGTKALSKVSRRTFGAPRADPAAWSQLHSSVNAAVNRAGGVAGPLDTLVSGFMSMRGEKGENESPPPRNETVGAPFAVTA